MNPTAQVIKAIRQEIEPIFKDQCRIYTLSDVMTARILENIANNLARQLAKDYHRQEQQEKFLEQLQNECSDPNS